MFNLSLSGNRVDISSSGIDFRITGTLISGTSYMMANIEAVGYDWDITSVSGTLVNVKLIVGLVDTCELRNMCFQVNNVRGEGVEVRNVRDTSGIGLDINWMHTNNSIGGGLGMDWVGWPLSYVRGGDYIYLQDVNGCGVNQDIKIREYQISSHTLGAAITVKSFTNVGNVYQVRMSYLENRKIAVLISGDFGDVPANYGYLCEVDFVASTVTEIGTAFDPICVYAFLKADGKIWLYIWGWTDDTYTACEMKYKNYTDGGAWGTSAAISNEDGSEPVFVGRKYLASMIPISGAPPQMTGFAFDLNTNTIITGDTVNGSAGRTNWTLSWLGVDNELEYVYATAVYYIPKGGGLWDQWEDWIKYNPATGDMTIINSKHQDNSPGDYASVVLSSKNNAYILEKPGGVVHKANNLSHVGTPLPANCGWTTLCILIEEGLSSIWWYDIPSESLYNTGIDGTAISNIEVLPISAWDIDYSIGVIVAGDCVIVTIKTQETGTYNYQWDHFVIT